MVTTTNLVFYAKCDDNAANTTVLDATGTSNGTATTNTSNLFNAGGVINSDFDFTATSSESVNCNFAPVTNSSFSWNFWINTTAADGFIISSSGQAGNDTEGINILIVSNKVLIGSGSGGAGRTLGSSTTTINDGNDHMITLVYNGTNGLIYVDAGVAEVNTAWNPYASNENVYMATRGPRASNYYDGEIDEVAIFEGEALSQTSVGELYNSGNGLAYPFITGWPGKIFGITPGKVQGIEVTNIAKVQGVS